MRGRTLLVAAAGAFMAVTVVTCLIAYPRMFTGFASYDDEGYMLVALRGFLRHGHLYDRTFSQYGPFYYELWGGLFSLLGISVDHDGGRTVTIVVWVLTSLTLGLATMRIAGSLLVGLAAQMLASGALVALTNEPMHPGGVVCLLLAGILAIACRLGERSSPRAAAVLGGAVAAVMLVKVNVGAFALAAVALACAVSYPALLRRRWLRPAVEAAFVAVPALVMLGQLGEPWVRQYAVHVSVAALAVVVVLRARERPRRPAAELGWLAGGFAAVAAVVCLAILAEGTSPGGLVDGVLRQPLHQADAFTLPLIMPRRFLAIDALALGGAVAYWHASRRREWAAAAAWRAATSLGAIAVGLLMALSVVGMTLPSDPGGLKGYPLGLLGFCWVSLTGAPPGGSRAAFARLVLPLLAVLEALHAFPVAGSQTAFASVMLIPVGAVCVADGTRRLAAARATVAWRRIATATAATAALVLLTLVANETLRNPLVAARAAYDASVPLELPGAGAVRVEAGEAKLYRAISVAIRKQCPALVTLPGMNSFYLWAREEPPTGQNATAWPTLFDGARQRRVIAGTRSIRGLCVLENAQLAQFWSGGPVSSGPLVRYMRQGFRPIASYGSYRLLKRENAKA